MQLHVMRVLHVGHSAVEASIDQLVKRVSNSVEGTPSSVGFVLQFVPGMQLCTAEAHGLGSLMFAIVFNNADQTSAGKDTAGTTIRYRMVGK